MLLAGNSMVLASALKFEAIGMPRSNPHSFRHALALLGERTCRIPEEFKAWSQNLGYEQVLITFGLGSPKVDDSKDEDVANAW